MKPIKKITMIIYIISKPNIGGKLGGAFAHTLGLINGFADNGIEELVISGIDHSRYCRKEIKWHIIPFFKYLSRMPILGRIIWDIKCVYKLQQVLKNKKVEFVYTRFSVGSCIIPLISILTTVSLVIEVNTPAAKRSENCILKKCFRVIDKINFFRAKKIILISEQLKSFMIQEYPEYKNKYVVSPNAVDPLFFNDRGKSRDLLTKYNIKTKSIIIGFSGSCMKYHGVQLLISVFNEINKKRKDDIGIKLLIIGALDSIEENKKDNINNIEEIIVTGRVPYERMPEYLSLCDILVTPLLEKNYASPIKLFEYMATGKCIIASDIGQQSDVIHDCENGLLFNIEDVQSLKKILLLAMENEELRKKLGSNARKYAEKLHSWQLRAKVVYNEMTH